MLPTFSYTRPPSSSGGDTYFDLPNDGYTSLYIPALNKEIWQRFYVAGYRSDGAEVMIFDTGIGWTPGTTSFPEGNYDVKSYTRLRFFLGNETYTVGGLILS